ncbi:hypothetical protein HJ586_09430 [Dickeya zeae]|nr:hypothetical protein HJ586_09430 [Dickeya zeae]
MRCRFIESFNRCFRDECLNELTQRYLYMHEASDG